MSMAQGENGDGLPTFADLPAATGATGLPPEVAQEALSSLLQEQGMASQEALSEVFEEDVIDEDAVRGDKPIPGVGDSRLELTDEDRDHLCSELLDIILPAYDSQMRERWERELEVEAYYSLNSDPTHGGENPDSERMASEMMMNLVDQIHARLVDAIMGVDPLIRVDPVVTDSATETMEAATDLAKSTERFLQSFGMREMDLQHILPEALHRTVKVGTAVLSPRWEVRPKGGFSYDDDGDIKENKETYGTIEVDMPSNRHMVVWPPERTDWQKLDVVGHRSFYTIGQWRGLAKVWELTEDQIDKVEGRGPSEDDLGDSERAKATMAVDEDREIREKLGHVKITNLYCSMVLPSREQETKFQVILSEDAREILWIDFNRHHNQKTPYFPIRYKIVDDDAWGMGAGDELIYCQAEDIALRNLGIDNLMAGAYWVNLCKAGTIADTLTDRVEPGQKIPVDNMEDWKPVKAGGEAPEIQSERQDNRNQATQAVSLSPVMSGHGDPTLKSGGGTGSTVALIEQGQKKVGQVDRTIRNDLDNFYMMILGMVSQWGTEGMYYRHVSKGDTMVLQLLEYTPVRGRVDDKFKVWAQAPNASTSREARKNTLMILWQFVNQAYQLELQLLEPILSQTNPAGLLRYKEEVVRFMSEMMKKIVDQHDIPGMSSLMPTLPETTPADQMMNQLMQENQQMQQQLMQLQQQMQMMQQPPMPEAPMGPPGPGGIPQ